MRITTVSMSIYKEYYEFNTTYPQSEPDPKIRKLRFRKRKASKSDDIKGHYKPDT